MKWIKEFLNGQIVPFDKMLHFFVGFFISAIFSFTYLWVNLIVLIFFSIGKEYFDKQIKKTQFDKKDALATFLGGVLAIIVIYFIIPYLNTV